MVAADAAGKKAVELEELEVATAAEQMTVVRQVAV